MHLQPTLSMVVMVGLGLIAIGVIGGLVKLLRVRRQPSPPETWPPRARPGSHRRP